MTKSIKKEYCAVCGKKTCYRDIRPLTLTYKNHSITVQQPGLWCDSCGEGILEGKDNKATREELQAFRSRMDGLLTPEEIHKIRKKILKISQHEAANIFGGGQNAFSRYERGELAPPRALSNLLRILSRHPNQLIEIYPKSAA